MFLRHTFLVYGSQRTRDQILVSIILFVSVVKKIVISRRLCPRIIQPYEKRMTDENILLHVTFSVFGSQMRLGRVLVPVTLLIAVVP